MNYNPNDWLIAEDVYGSEFYIFHRARPTFLARVFDDEDTPIKGLTMSLANGQILAEIVWYDTPVVETKVLAALAENASKALDAYDGILQVDLQKSIKNEVSKQGLTLQALEDLSGVSKSTISDFLKDRHEIGSGKVNAIMQALGLVIR